MVGPSALLLSLCAQYHCHSDPSVDMIMIVVIVIVI